jgi:hypothetical protein
MTVNETGLLLKSACPVCLSTGVKRNGSAKGFRAPAFVCPSCNSYLKASPTLRVLWAFAAVAVGIPLAFAISHFARQTLHLQGTLLAALHGAMFAGLAAYSFKLAFSGFVYRRWEQ